MLDQHSPNISEKAQLRKVLLWHIQELGDPILKALQGSGLSVRDVALIWRDFFPQVDAAYNDTLLQSTPAEALRLAEEKKQEIAARILAAKEAA